MDIADVFPTDMLALYQSFPRTAIVYRGNAPIYQGPARSSIESGAPASGSYTQVSQASSATVQLTFPDAAKGLLKEGDIYTEDGPARCVIGMVAENLGKSGLRASGSYPIVATAITSITLKRWNAGTQAWATLPPQMVQIGFAGTQGNQSAIPSATASLREGWVFQPRGYPALDIRQGDTFQWRGLPATVRWVPPSGERTEAYFTADVGGGS